MDLDLVDLTHTCMRPEDVAKAVDGLMPVEQALIALYIALFIGVVIGALVGYKYCRNGGFF